VTIEMPNPTKEGESTLTFKWKGLAWIYTPPTNNIEGHNK
jgi:hypothetical protein